MTRRTIPAVILIGAVLSVAASFTFWAALLSEGDGALGDAWSRIIRWQMFAEGCTLASGLLITSGLFWIAGRLSRWQRTLALITAWIQVAGLAWILARPVLLVVMPTGPTIELVVEWVWRIVGLAFAGGMVLLTVATRAYWRPRSALVPIAAVLLVLLEIMTSVPELGSWIHSLSRDHETIYRLIWPVREVLSSGAFLVVIHALMQDTTEPLPDPNGATAWFRRAEATILIKIIAAVVIALVGLARAPSAIKVVLLVGPLLNVATTLGLAWCLLSVDRAAIPGMPRIRLLLGAAIAAWSAKLTMFQSMALYKISHRDGDSFGGDIDAAAVDAWGIIGPLIGVAGVALVCSAIARFALVRGNEALRETAIARAIIHGVLIVAMIGMPFLLTRVTSTGTLLIVTLMLAGAAIASQAVLLAVMRRASEAIGTVPELPEARLR